MKIPLSQSNSLIEKNPRLTYNEGFFNPILHDFTNIGDTNFKGH
jgi:hypothetical protein